MILVLSRLRQLSGNNIIVILCLAWYGLSLSSCARKVIANTPGRDVQIITPDKDAPIEPSPKGDEPVAPKNENIKDEVPTKSTTKPKSSTKNPLTSYKDRYNVKMLIPLKASSGDATNEKYVQFYAGVLEALNQLDEEGVKLKVNVFDTEDGASIQSKTSEVLTSDTDLVIGPFEKDDIKVYAESCKNMSIPLVSPWQSSSKAAIDNPYFIQLKPNLREHFKKIVASITLEYKAGEVAIIGDNTKDVNAWITYFQACAKELTGKDNYFKSAFASSSQLKAGSTFNSLMSQGVKAFILPHYSFNDEDYVTSALKRLQTDKGNKTIAVYGMPLLYDSDKVDFSYFQSLNIRMVMSDFVDQNATDLREFRRQYLDKYGEIPSVDAIKGYDMMLYLGRSIWRHGKSFQYELSNDPSSFLASNFLIMKTKAEDSTTTSESSEFDFFENKHLDIIEFKDARFSVRP
jgi:ABC-type branched-subunit amino acid transport system substrate-binding protein